MEHIQDVREKRKTYLDVSSAGAHGEDGEVLRGLQPAEHEGAEDGGEWAPAHARKGDEQRKDSV